MELFKKRSRKSCSYILSSLGNKEKKRMIDNRVLIGKVSDENLNLMYPNNRFAEIFNPIDEEVEALRSFYYSEKRREAGQIDIVISYAPYVVLKKCGEKSDMIDALNRSMTSMSDSIFAISIHTIVSMDLLLNYFFYDISIIIMELKFLKAIVK